MSGPTPPTPLASLLAQTATLVSKKSAGAPAADVAQSILQDDKRLRAGAATLLEQRSMRQQLAAVNKAVADKQAALLRLAGDMHAAKMRLAGSIHRAREAISRADEAAATDRTAKAATIIEYAERVSYTNAAPSSLVAFEGAAKAQFYAGWGTPAPSQGMLQASCFAQGNLAAVTADRGAAPSAPTQTLATANSTTATGANVRKRSADAPPDEQPSPERPAAPSFTAVPPVPQAPRADGEDGTRTGSPAAAAHERAPVSLGFGSDDESSDDEFG